MNAWGNAKRILAVRLDAMGDVLMTTPALRALKQGGRHLTLLTSAAGAAVAELIPEIDDCIVYDAPWLKASAPRNDRHDDFAMIERLRRAQFDAAVIFTVYSQSPLPAALLCYLADIPLRLAHCRENPYQLLSDWIVETEPTSGIRHEVQRQLDLVAHVGARTDDTHLSLAVPPFVHATIDGVIEDRDTPLIVLHPGASAPSRRYPAHYFAAALRALPPDYRLVITGSRDEYTLAEQIRRDCGRPAARNLAGALTLDQLVALIQRADVLLCNNTGPAHMAAAVGTPVVVLYALTNPQHTPWQVARRVLSHDVDCKYCYKSVCPRGHHACLENISPVAVAAAVQELLAQRRPTSRATAPEDIALCIP